MDGLYNFLIGPALWVTLLIFAMGLISRVFFLYGLSRERDRVFYNHMSWSWALRSMVHWLIPWGSASMRNQPIFSFAFFLFHILLFGIPIFLSAHNILLYEWVGWSLWTLPDAVADILTLVMMVTIGFLFLRRLIRPEVRILTTAWDYTLLALTFLPFLTGFLAYHQLGPYPLMLILHIVFSQVLLVIIPFSKLGHVILWFFSRSFIGFEMGERRGARSW
jgi:nitrate reductase gamma subunit